MTLDAAKDTGKKQRHNPTASPRQKASGTLLTKMSQIRVGRIRNHDVALPTGKQTHSPHTPAPQYELLGIFLLPQVIDNRVDILPFVVAQGDELALR